MRPANGGRRYIVTQSLIGWVHNIIEGIGDWYLWCGSDEDTAVLHKAIDIDRLVQDCSISSALALEILQTCTKLFICSGSLKRKCHFEELFITGCPENCWWKAMDVCMSLYLCYLSHCITYGWKCSITSMISIELFENNVWTTSH